MQHPLNHFFTQQACIETSLCSKQIDVKWQILRIMAEIKARLTKALNVKPNKFKYLHR